MSDQTTPSYKRIDATSLIDKLELLDGVSEKTGNPYLIPTLYLKSPISDTPIRLEFKYIDANTVELIKLGLRQDNEKSVNDFQEGLQG